ncbi:MAG TPA: nitrilase-related carbon-nitrogen hydrolase [Acidimicrobiales bacterium]|nr:nitrilase-related carbon-nitrogen hydrolase [Acidimicrobiales bacterium]
MATPASRLRVAAVQHDICWEDREATLSHLEPLVATAAAAGARLTVLTEMFAVGFTPHAELVGEPPGGPTTEWLLAEARRYGMWVCGSAPIVPHGAARPFNRLVLAGPEGELASYDKVHPFRYAGEDRRFATGTARAVTVDVDGTRATLTVCYDLRFADQFWEAAPETDLFVVVANWPAARRHHWRSLLLARAIENQAYVVAANRVGTGGKESYAGDSCIVDPWGEVLAQASGVETVLVADVDREVVARVRKEYPFMRDR